MERKEINAILVNDFEEFLKTNGLYERFITEELKCSVCEKSITSENIAMIYYSNGYQFCCDNNDCLGKRWLYDDYSDSISALCYHTTPY